MNEFDRKLLRTRFSILCSIWQISPISNCYYLYPNPMHQFVASREVAAPYGLACSLWTPTLMTRFDKHREVEVNLFVAGRIRYWIGGRTYEIAAGEAAIFWADVPHQVIDFSPDCSYYVLTIPIGDFMHWQLPESFVKSILHGEPLLYRISQTLESDTERFSTWIDDLESGQVDRVDICKLEIQARLLRWSLEARTPSSPSLAPKLRGALFVAEQIALYVNANATKPISASSVGDHFGLHPNSVMRLFKRAFNRSFGNYVTEVRVLQAQRLLATTDDLIELIGLRSGFSSTSRFNHVFKASLGCSPREYRNSARSKT